MNERQENLIFKLLEMLMGGDSGKAPAVNSDYSDHPLIGEFVIVRCRDAGVHAGELISIDGQTVILKNSRRMWRWRCNSEMSLSAVARHGLNQGKSKVAGLLIKPITLIGACEVIGFESDTAMDSIKSAEVHNEQQNGSSC